MKSEDNNLLLLIQEKFPRQNHRITQLFEESADFRSLCKDYFTCIQSLKKFKKSYTEEEKSIEEYQSIQSELEKEIYDFLFP